MVVWTFPVYVDYLLFIKISTCKSQNPLLVRGIPTELKEHLYQFQVKHRVLQKQFLHNELFLFFMIDNHCIMLILREVFPEKN